MKTVGYLEGTDGIYLTRLTARGVDTLPLGNGADNHGKYIGFIEKTDSISLVIAYLHKVFPLSNQNTTSQDMLVSCRLLNIPVLLIVPKELQESVRKMDKMKGIGENVQLVDPVDVMEEARRILGV